MKQTKTERAFALAEKNVGPTDDKALIMFKRAWLKGYKAGMAKRHRIAKNKEWSESIMKSHKDIGEAMG